MGLTSLSNYFKTRSGELVKNIYMHAMELKKYFVLYIVLYILTRIHTARTFIYVPCTPVVYQIIMIYRMNIV